MKLAHSGIVSVLYVYILGLDGFGIYVQIDQLSILNFLLLKK